MKPFFTIILFLASLMAGTDALAAKVYKWVDADGVTHFSEHPPKGTPTTLIKPKVGHSDPVDYANPADATDKTDAAAQRKAEEAITQSLKDPTRCAAAKKNLETLQNFGRVKVKNENGEGFHYLTESEQQERLTTTRKAIDESC